MTILVFGVALWWGAHLWKRVAPGSRAGVNDDKARAIVVAALAVSILLMIFGYRGADMGAVWWGPSAMAKGMNNLLVLAGFYLFAVSGMKTGLARRIRHPQLTGFALWALAHLLPNGDLPSLLLFGGLLLWALVEMVVINRAQPGWAPPAHAVPVLKEVIAVGGTLVLFGAVSLIHIWLGYNPFGA